MRSALALASLLALSIGCSKSPDCGVCPAGSTCGAVNGDAVCRAPSGIPLFNHVFVILMENTSLSTLQASSAAPYLAGLTNTAAWSPAYFGVAHPSLPNYLALTSGSRFDVTCDCDPLGPVCESNNCNAFSSSCGCPQTANNLGDQLETAGKSWRAYGEDMGAPCNIVTSGNYAARHVPFLYYTDIQTDSARCANHVVDFAADFAQDLALPAASAPALLFIAPNLIDDMHNPFPASDTNLANGDNWLKTVVPQITASAAYKDHGILFIVWDEDDLSGLVDPDAAIPFFLLSSSAKQSGFNSTTAIDHYALLATIEDGLGLPRLGSAVQAKPLTDFFPAQ